MITTALQEQSPILHDDILYQALVASVDDVIVSTDKNFIIKTFNKAAEKVYEIAAEDAIGKKVNSILFHQYIDTIEEKAQKKLLQESYWKGVVKVITRSGKIVFLQSVITALKSETNKKLGYVGVSRNITQDISLKQSLRHFESILSLTDKSFLIVDSDMKIVFMSTKGQVQRYFNSDYQVGDDAFRYLEADQVEIVKQSYDKAFAGEIINYNSESNTEPKQYVNITYAPLRDDFLNVTHACVIIKDITAQREVQLLEDKKAAIEKSLFESRKFFEDFMENSPLLAWIVDEEGRLEYMNHAYQNLFTIKLPELKKSIFNLYPKEFVNESIANIKKVIETGEILETIEKRHPSLPKTYKVIKFPIFLNGKKMVAAWGTDISEEIETQESLSLLNQNKNKIMSVIAHDIRAPIGTSCNFVQSIIEDFKTYESDELLQYLNLMQQSLSKCFTLTEELLLWARSQMETIIYNPLPLEADVEINKIVENIIAIAEDKKIIIETRFCYMRKIFADADMLAIVVRNLLTNAIKFSKPGSTIHLTTKIADDKLLISVTDTGVGIKKELVNKILSKLNYESSFGTKGEKGAGVGLLIAKDYIERNNGNLYIQSQEGVGSTFSFTVNFVTA